MCADVLRCLHEFLTLQDAECEPLDLAKGNRVGNTAVKEHVQYLADALNAFVALLLKGKNLLLHTLLGGGIHFANLVDQGVDQIVVDLPVTLPKEAQQIEACHAGGQLLQLLHGVVIDERGIVGKTVVRDPQFRNQRFRRIVQNCQGAAPRDFTLGLTQREVLGIAFQRRDGIHPVAFGIELVERLDRSDVQSSLEDLSQSSSFSSQGLAHHILQKAVAWHDDASAFQILQETAEQKDRLG